MDEEKIVEELLDDGDEVFEVDEVKSSVNVDNMIVFLVL